MPQLQTFRSLRINVFRGHHCILQSNLWVGCSLTDMFSCNTQNNT